MHHDGVCRALVADNSSDAFLQQWIATSAKLYSDVVQVESLFDTLLPPFDGM